jgi:hypothetical protein
MDVPAIIRIGFCSYSGGGTKKNSENTTKQISITIVLSFLLAIF